jgi:hypothetical protein
MLFKSACLRCSTLPRFFAVCVVNETGSFELHCESVFQRKIVPRPLYSNVSRRRFFYVGAALTSTLGAPARSSAGKGRRR